MRGAVQAMTELAGLQQLARDAQREALARACAAADQRAAEEARAEQDRAESAAALDAVYARPSLCLVSLSLAGRRLALGEAALDRARAATREARDDEDTARASLAEAGHRARFVGERARGLRRKHADKRAEAAIAETIALGLARERRP